MKKTISFLSCALIIGCLSAFIGKQPAKPTVFALNIQNLERNKAKVNAKDPSVAAAYKLLIKDATKALELGPVSVMEKTNVPPSGNKHDYVSLAPYFWPDPSKAD